MDSSRQPGTWARFAARAQALGLNVLLVQAASSLPPQVLEHLLDAGAEALPAPGPSAAHDAPPPRPAPPGPALRVVLLGSAGQRFWRRFQAWPGRASAGPHPLDAFTAVTARRLLAGLLAADRAVRVLYPFTHARKLLPIQALTEAQPGSWPRPFGLSVHPECGPWFAWRAVLLTSLPWPLTPAAAASPCVSCPAPCVAACPAQAVHPGGFDWQACVDFRAREEPCRETCLAREACPAGPGFRYAAGQLAFHYRASLRWIRSQAASGPGAPQTPPAPGTSAPR
ncbi:MAG TPA: hypothetical protein VL359_15375 [bacterium]|nr:hypothetical protein [bacterium]